MAKAQASVVSIIKAAFKDFGNDECGVRAAALAYYTVFALPPLLILLVMIAGRIWSPEQVQHSLETQFSGMMGQSGASQIHEMIAHGQQTAGGGLFATIASVVGLILGATGAFLSLQDALNRAWEVKPDPKQGGIMNLITKRLLTLGMVLGLGFLLAVSLAMSAAITALGGMMGGSLPPAVMYVLDLVVSLGVLVLLFAALFKMLPDAEIAWRDVWVGAGVTAALFVIGKFAIGLYLGRSKPGDAFGAAGALAVVLVWAYYAGMILLFGAEFTQEWATQRGQGIQPAEGAIRVTLTEEEVPAGHKRGDQPKAPAAAATAASTAASRPPRGGVADWLLGLPILVLLFKRQRR